MTSEEFFDTDDYRARTIALANKLGWLPRPGGMKLDRFLLRNGPECPADEAGFACLDALLVLEDENQEDEAGYNFLCGRCGTTACGNPELLVAAIYRTDDPWQASGNLCPDCAADDDELHIPGSWLLSWY